jgi:hypothetical protein
MAMVKRNAEALQKERNGVTLLNEFFVSAQIGGSALLQ